MSASAYINKRRVTTLAKGTKVQYNNHSVSVDSLINSVIPCILTLDQIRYIKKTPCGCPTTVIQIIDGGSPGSQSHLLDGGYPLTNGRVIDFGRI